MSQDLKLVADENGFYDLAVTNSDFSGTDGLLTAINVSLLTDARADAGNVPDPSRRRGYVGDILTSELGRSLGSRLWLYSQSRLTDDIINAIRNESRNALLWLIDDGVARSVDVVKIGKTGVRSLRVEIKITTNDGNNQVYTVLWRQTNAD
jgi:phage gp46-like protein